MPWKTQRKDLVEDHFERPRKLALPNKGCHTLKRLEPTEN